MARYEKRTARFFVAKDGTVFVRAKALTRRQRAAVFQRDRFVCRYCGRRVLADTYLGHLELSLGMRTANIDHVLPISRGGQNDDANLVTACRHCNSSKGADRPLPSTPNHVSRREQEYLS